MVNKFCFRRLEEKITFMDKTLTDLLTPRGTGILENFSERKSSKQLQTPKLLNVEPILQKLISNFAKNIIP